MRSTKKKNNAFAGMYPTTTGEVELRPDSFQSGAWEILVNGVPSSHIAVDPLDLHYEYMRWIAAAIRYFVDSHLDPQQLRITHLGGGACSIARYLVATYPRSRNTVVELDGELARLVRLWFDLPRSPQLKIRQGDARDISNKFLAHSRDIIIRDVFAGSTTPLSVSTVEFFRTAATALAPNGLYIANCGDRSNLANARAELAGMSEAFAHIACIASPSMLKGRHSGNIILLGSQLPLPEQPAQLTKLLLADRVPAHYKNELWTRKFFTGSKPWFDHKN
ncbi:spermidine synthase [Corynebacterium kutscheri]|nr:fused MFS/spermidine synthase [Corynebacterium kutscheri]